MTDMYIDSIVRIVSWHCVKKCVKKVVFLKNYVESVSPFGEKVYHISRNFFMRRNYGFQQL